MQPEDLTPERCKLVITLLSLDMTIPFYDDMGLLLEDEVRTAFVAEVRHIIDRIGGVAYTTPIPESLPAELGHRLRARFGTEVAERFADWAIFLHEEYPADHPHTYAWSCILRWCAADRLRWKELKLPAKRSEALRKRFNDVRDYEEVEARLEANEQAPRSPWDARILEQRRYDDGTPWEPNVSIDFDVSQFRFRMALRDLLEQLSDEEITLLWEQGRRVAAEQELPTPVDLRAPDDPDEPCAQGE